MKVYLLPWGIYVRLVEGGTCHGARRKGTTHLKSITAEKKKHFYEKIARRYDAQNGSLCYAVQDPNYYHQ